MPLTRTELLLILLITAAGLTVRFAFLDELAIEHFDEGVYASNLWFPDSGYAYPDRHLYAPPLLPWMIETSMLVFGEAKWVPCLPALLLGAFTVPLAWLAARRWFDPAVGVALAAVIALNDFHIALSRSALTDAPLLFFVLLAVWLASEAINRVDLRIAVAAGLATSLAWATKYNGWLPIAISVTGVVAMFVVKRFRRAHDDAARAPVDTYERLNAKDSAIVLAVMVVVAAAAWSPVLLGLDEAGGYAAVAANHRNYVVGLSGWLPSFGRHMSTGLSYFGPLTCIGGLSGGAAAWTLRRSCSTWNAGSEPNAERSTWNTEFDARAAFAIAMLPCLLLVPLIVAVVLIYGLVRSALSRKLDSPTAAQRAGGWLTAAWLGGLLVATPFYQPYPRLILPLLTVTWCLSCVWTVLVFRWRSPEPDDQPAPTVTRSSGKWLFRILTASLATATFAYSVTNGCPAWQKRSGLAETAELAVTRAAKHCEGEQATAAVDFVIYVYGEPGLFFHLPRDGVAIQPVTDLNFALPGSGHPRVPTFVMTGPNTHNDSQFADHFATAGDALEQVAVFQYEASDFVLLDDHRLSEVDDHRTAKIELYRVRFK